MANLNNFSQNNIQEIIGNNTFFSWASFPNATTSTPNIRVHKQGNFVILYFDNFSSNNTQVSAFISPNNALPIQYRPALRANGIDQLYIKIIDVIYQSSATVGAVTINNEGVVSIYSDPTLTPFQGGGTCGWNTFTVEYMTA